MTRVLSRIVKCDVCHSEEITEKAAYPLGWAMTWEHSFILCDKCLARYEEKFGEEPPIWERGGEKVINLMDEWM